MLKLANELGLLFSKLRLTKNLASIEKHMHSVSLILQLAYGLLWTMITKPEIKIIALLECYNHAWNICITFQMS